MKDNEKEMNSDTKTMTMSGPSIGGAPTTSSIIVGTPSIVSTPAIVGTPSIDGTKKSSQSQVINSQSQVINSQSNHKKKIILVNESSPFHEKNLKFEFSSVFQINFS